VRIITHSPGLGVDVEPVVLAIAGMRDVGACNHHSQGLAMIVLRFSTSAAGIFLKSGRNVPLLIAAS
jgi:hypothetical protein